MGTHNETVARQREDEVVLLYTRDRMTFRQIAEHIGADVKNVHMAWVRGRDRLHKEATESFGAYVGEQLATCKEVIDGLMPILRKGGMNGTLAAKGIVSAMDHEAKLLGLYAPTKQNVQITDEMTARIKALADEFAQLEET
jgi:hypothetical protein